ncbi:transposase family protein [Arthrobacter sp. ISL-85]|uniref:transposase family protein n=1 Tax=Arthrobacter sp. ISL-85 TaxID=2819115 RepID=UPI0020365A12|nr:transposase family protein [Arthrobacter sp. ISL-85]
MSTSVTAGRRQVIVETDQPPGCPSCGVIASRRKERRLQRLRDIPVAGPVEVLWSKYRWYCEEPACDRLSFFESTPQVPHRARSTRRLRDQLVDAVIRSGRAVSETALSFAVSWWMVRSAVTEAWLLHLSDVDKLNPRMLGIDEHRFLSVRVLSGPGSEGVDPVRAVDDGHRGSGHRTGPRCRGRPGLPGHRGMVVRPAR